MYRIVSKTLFSAKRISQTEKYHFISRVHSQCENNNIVAAEVSAVRIINEQKVPIKLDKSGRLPNAAQGKRGMRAIKDVII